MKLSKRVKAVAKNDVVQTAAWIGFSAAVTAIAAYLLQRPELLPYYGVINFVLYAIKSAKKKK